MKTEKKKRGQCKHVITREQKQLFYRLCTQTRRLHAANRLSQFRGGVFYLASTHRSPPLSDLSAAFFFFRGPSTHRGRTKLRLMLWGQSLQWHHMDTVLAWTRLPPQSLICLLVFPYNGRTGQKTGPMIAGATQTHSPGRFTRKAHFWSNLNQVLDWSDTGTGCSYWRI